MKTQILLIFITGFLSCKKDTTPPPVTTVPATVTTTTVTPADTVKKVDSLNVTYTVIAPAGDTIDISSELCCATGCRYIYFGLKVGGFTWNFKAVKGMLLDNVVIDYSGFQPVFLMSQTLSVNGKQVIATTPTLGTQKSFIYTF